MAWCSLMRAIGAAVVLCAAVDVACAQNLIKNGSFTEGTGQPAEWGKAEADAGKGTLRAIRDTQTFVSPPASFCIEAVGGAPATGKSMQVVQPAKSGSYRVRGELKTSNVVCAGIALLPFGSGGKQLGWNDVAFIDGSGDWTDFDVITFLPEGTESVGVLPFGEFSVNGKLWVDDLSMEAVADPKNRVTIVDLAGSTLRNAYNAWGNQISPMPEGMKVTASGEGAATMGRWIDVSAKSNYVPVLYIKPLAENTAPTLQMTLTDEKGGDRVYRFKMPTKTNVVMPVLPEGTATISRPDEGPGGPTPYIKAIRLSAAGEANINFAAIIRGVELVAPGQTVSAMPAKSAVKGTSGGASAQAPAKPTGPVTTAGYGTPIVPMRELVAADAYGAWKGKVTNTGESMEVHQALGNGGTWARQHDLSALADGVPAILVKTLPGNKAKQLAMVLKDVPGVHANWNFELPPQGEAVYVKALGGKTLGSAKLDLSRITEIHLQGDYAHPDSTSVVVTRFDAVMPGQGDLKPGVPPQKRPQGATADPPVIRNVAVQSAAYVAVEIDSQSVAVTPPKKYTQASNDVLEDVSSVPNMSKLTRDDKLIGYVDTETQTLYAADVLNGAAFLAEEGVKADMYQLTSKDDRNYIKPIAPVSAEVKLRPIDYAMPSMEPVLRYTVYLKFAKPLTPERNYELAIAGDIKAAKFRFSALRTRGEALHLNQVGFRPDDPVKAGCVSLWLGTGGKFPLTAKSFNVIEDGSGKSVIQGKLEAPKSDSISGTDVYLMDFSSLKMPGKYRLYVPELGVTEPFRVDAAAWEEPLLMGLRGFYAQRSGIEIGPPYAESAQKRSYYPLDGVRIRLAKFSMLQTSLAPGGEGEDYRKLCASEQGGAVITDAFGGYLDSGTSTVRRIQHLDATRMMLELDLMFPAYYSKLTLNVPKTGRKQCDIIDEALWNLDFYHALQQPAGGVPGAVVDPTPNIGYPVPPMMSKELFATAPDVYSTYTYAATAARLAIALKSSNAAIASKYQQSATKAMEWAENQLGSYQAPNDAIKTAIRDRRNLAAVDLLRLTGIKVFHDIFAASTCLTQSPAMAYRTGPTGYDQREAVFIYARMPESLVDTELRKTAMVALKNDADAALALANSNAWGIVANPDSQLGIYGSFPAMSLMHGHYVLKDEAYLKAAISHASFLVGGNPSNLSFITGVGSAAVANVTHPYTRIIRQPLPKGLTVFGPFAQTSNLVSLDVVKQHVAEVCAPPLAEWPAAETYFDSYIITPECGYTIHETMGPTVYLLGYLAAR